MHSAMTLRAELPVHRKSTLNVLSAMDASRLLGFGDGSEAREVTANLGVPVAAVAGQEGQQPARALDVQHAEHRKPRLVGERGQGRQGCPLFHVPASGAAARRLAYRSIA